MGAWSMAITITQQSFFPRILQSGQFPSLGSKLLDGVLRLAQSSFSFVEILLTSSLGVRLAQERSTSVRAIGREDLEVDQKRLLNLLRSWHDELRIDESRNVVDDSLLVSSKILSFSLSSYLERDLPVRSNLRHDLELRFIVIHLSQSHEVVLLSTGISDLCKLCESVEQVLLVSLTLRDDLFRISLISHSAQDLRLQIVEVMVILSERSLFEGDDGIDQGLRP